MYRIRIHPSGAASEVLKEVFETRDDAAAFGENVMCDWEIVRSGIEERDHHAIVAARDAGTAIEAAVKAACEGPLANEVIDVAVDRLTVAEDGVFDIRLYGENIHTFDYRVNINFEGAVTSVTKR